MNAELDVAAETMVGDEDYWSAVIAKDEKYYITPLKSSSIKYQEVKMLLSKMT